MNKQKLKEVKLHFQDMFQTDPLLVFSPGRINLIGEHTDYNEGFVFPAAIDKGIYLAIGQADTDVSTVIASDMNETYSFSPHEVRPIVNGGWKNFIVGVVGEMQKMGINIPNFNCVFSGDIPSGSGMSSSAALENSIVFGLNEIFELGLTKHEMIHISQRAEHNYVGVKCGIMDQYASMFGKENGALLLDCRTVESISHYIDFHDYRILLINSNVKHELSESAYNERRAVCEHTAELLKVKALRDATLEDLSAIKDQISDEDFQKVSYVIEENARVDAFAKAIQLDDLKQLGDLIYASHKGLSEKYKVSCEELDFLVNETIDNANILGARMMGGGFGGCTINIIHKDEIESFSSHIQQSYTKQFNKACSIYSVNLVDGTRLIQF